jgi:hypothetical protein
MRAAAESPIPSRPPDARELFDTRVSVAPSGLSPPPALSTLHGGSRCGVRVRRASCGASPIAPGASATPRSLPRSSTRINSEVFLGYPQPHNLLEITRVRIRQVRTRKGSEGGGAQVAPAQFYAREVRPSAQWRRREGGAHPVLLLELDLATRDDGGRSTA